MDTLLKVINAASTVRDLAQEAKSYQFMVEPPVTFYLHAEYASVEIRRWAEPQILAEVELQAGFGWRVKTEQDEAGVYLVTKRRAVVGNLSRARFRIRVPHDTYLALRLLNSALTLDGISGTLNIAPPDTNGNTHIIEMGSDN